jgi:hypothetical protein
MDSVRSWTYWGENCPKIFNGNRSGFCEFQVKHGFAAVSAGLHALTVALAQDPSKFPLTQIVTTEVDGATRNGFSYKYASHIHKGSGSWPPWRSKSTPGVAMCMYRYAKNSKNRNCAPPFDNCVPHACLDPKDNPKINRWWEPKLFSIFVNFFSGTTPVSGEQNRSWSGGRDECVDLPLGTGAFLREPWIGGAVLPAASPAHKWELSPGPLWQAFLLHADFWTEKMCKANKLRWLLIHYVDCTVFDPPVSSAARVKGRLSDDASQHVSENEKGTQKSNFDVLGQVMV